jgi:crotonobetainyl-CoA:carnitine CoA-transferase CaiB-like acyl-CoA transferase
MTGPLDGLLVFDMTHAAVGPWATMLLAGMGADVIKVEPPAGDLIHSVPPKQKGHGVVYAHCNLNKRSIKLDLKDEGERAHAYRILRHADIYIENMRPGVAARLGFDYETVARINPSIVYVNTSAWGSTGPMGRMSGADGPIQAFSGFTSINGSPDGPGEYFRHFGYVDLNTSQNIVLAVLEALMRRARTGEGQRVEVTMLGSALMLQYTRIAEYLGVGMAPKRMGSASPTVVPDQAFACLDHAYIAVTATNDEQWRGLCRALGAEDLAAEPRFATNPDRVKHRQEVVHRLEAFFRSKPRRWWELKLAEQGVPHGRFMDFEEIRYHPQVRENRFVRTLQVPHQGEMNFGALPWNFDGVDLPFEPPPASGQHTDEVLKEYADKSVEKRLPEAGPRESIAGTLEGITVVDTTQGLSGPFGSMFLAEMGAQVIKVEPPEGDYAREFGPPFLDGGEGASFFYMNRTKRRVRLDLSNQKGMDELRRLIGTADAFMEDFGPGVADGMGLGYDALREANPRLIHCSMSAFGEKGPEAGRPGSELVMQAMADCWQGLGALDEPPIRMGADAASLSNGLHAAQAILAALYQRRRTGVGQRVSVSMYGSALHMRGLSWVAQTDPDAWGGYHVEHPTMPKDHGYKTRDLPVFFGLDRGSEEDFQRLLIELGLEEAITDPRFAEGGGRLATGTRLYAYQVKHIWERGFASRTAQEVVEIIERHNGEAVIVNDYPTLFAHEQLQAIEAVVEVEHPTAGRLRAIRLPWRIGDNQAVGPERTTERA